MDAVVVPDEEIDAAVRNFDVPRLGNSGKLFTHSHRVLKVLKDMAANKKVEFLVSEWIGEYIEIDVMEHSPRRTSFERQPAPLFVGIGKFVDQNVCIPVCKISAAKVADDLHGDSNMLAEYAISFPRQNQLHQVEEYALHGVLSVTLSFAFHTQSFPGAQCTRSRTRWGYLQEIAHGDSGEGAHLRYRQPRCWGILHNASERV